MSEDITVHIEIGGKLKEADVDEFLGTLDCLYEWWRNDDLSVQPDLKKLLAATNNGKKSLKLGAHANYGVAADITCFCEGYDLSYIKHDEARYEYSAELNWWTPEGGPGSSDINQEGDALVRSEPIRRLVTAAIKLAVDPLGHAPLLASEKNPIIEDIVQRILKGETYTTDDFIQVVLGELSLPPDIPPLEIIK